MMQIGENAYEPKNAKYFRFASKEELDGLCGDAMAVACPAGVGSILTALEHGRSLQVPRQKKYGKHVDDRQLDIAGEMEKEGGDVGVLGDVSAASGIKVENGGKLVKALKKYLEDISRN